MKSVLEADEVEWMVEPTFRSRWYPGFPERLVFDPDLRGVDLGPPRPMRAGAGRLRQCANREDASCGVV